MLHQHYSSQCICMSVYTVKFKSVFAALSVTLYFNSSSKDEIAYVLCSRNVYRAPITPFSRTSGVWVCPWLKWPLDVSLFHHLMLWNWNRSLAFQWKGKQPPASLPQSHDPLGGQAAVSLWHGFILWFCTTAFLMDLNYFQKIVWHNWTKEINYIFVIKQNLLVSLSDE